MSWLRRWLLVALDAVPWETHIAVVSSLDVALGELVEQEDELALAWEAYEALAGLWVPEDAPPTVQGMMPFDGEEGIVR